MTLLEARVHSCAVLDDRRLKPELLPKVAAVLEDLRGKAGPGVEFLAFEGWRSPARQLQLFLWGFSKLRHGLHCRGRAVDVVPVVERADGSWAWSWDASLRWDLVGKAAHAHGLTWGGDWLSFVDLVHLQL